MSRGGRRENAGRRSSWESGRTFAQTKPIRVPVEFAGQLLELAHQWDARRTVDLDLDTKSKERNSDEIEALQESVVKLQERVKYLESQLSSTILDEKRTRALALLKKGTQAPEYKGAKKVLTIFVDLLSDSVTNS